MECVALVLAGGFGTRLRPVESNNPKPMVEVNGRPFLFWLVKQLTECGYDHFIFSVGYKAKVITQYPWPKEFPKNIFEYVIESKPLGTGGGVQEAFKSFHDLKSAWVFNGDTIIDSPLPPSPPKNEVHYACLTGDLLFDAAPNVHVRGDRVVKIGDGGEFFDGGQVFVHRCAVEKYDGPLPVSLHALLAKSFEEEKVGYTVVPGTCYDIGTPKRLDRFKQFLSRD